MVRDGTKKVSSIRLGPDKFIDGMVIIMDVPDRNRTCDPPGYKPLSCTLPFCIKFRMKKTGNRPKRWARQESNLRPGGYEPLALTAELRARVNSAGEIERVTGFEPVNVSLEG